jgi:hypothetical protein
MSERQALTLFAICMQRDFASLSFETSVVSVRDAGRLPRSSCPPSSLHQEPPSRPLKAPAGVPSDRRTLPSRPGHVRIRDEIRFFQPHTVQDLA